MNINDSNLMNKVLSGEASKEEIVLFNQKIKKDAELEHEYIKLEKGLKQHLNLKELFSLDIENDWNKVHKGIKRSQRIKRRIGWQNTNRIPLFDTLIRIAAGIIIFIGLGYGLLKLIDDGDKKDFLVLKVPYGAKNTIELADGTVVDLNSGSVLKIPTDFNTNNRTVTLEGEGYFDVTKSDIPFIVNTSTININVHGTKFNVKTYKNEKFVETTLIEGSLSVKKKNINTKKTKIRTLKLVPNQKLILNKQTNNMVLLSVKKSENNGQEKSLQQNQKIDVEQFEKENVIPIVQISDEREIESSIAWKEGLILLKQETLEHLAINLERMYDLKFEFENEKIKKYTISGTLRKFTVDQLLDGLKLMLPINYEIKENKVKIYEKK